MHDANAEVVRRMARTFVLIASWIGPNGRTGHKLQGHRLNVSHLASRIGVDAREIDRYLAVFRSAGLLTCWQPPTTSDAPKGNKSGHCFNLYELPNVPAELVALLASFHRAWWPRSAAVIVSAPAHGAQREPLTSTGLAVFERFKPPD